MMKRGQRRAEEKHLPQTEGFKGKIYTLDKNTQMSIMWVHSGRNTTAHTMKKAHMGSSQY